MLASPILEAAMRKAMHDWRFAVSGALVIALAALSCKDAVTPMSRDRATPADIQNASVMLAAATQEICGPVATTVVITENTRLACDVECVNASGPCIQFGRNNITLF